MSWTKPGAVLVAGVMSVCLLVTRDKGRSTVPGAGQTDAAAQDLFAGTNVPALRIELDRASLRDLRERPREWAKGTLRTGNDVYTNVAVHIKGSQGSLQPIDAKPSLTVSFSRLGKGRKFLGLRKIHLNNSAEDPSFMTEIVCGELCRKAGLPAARSTHVSLNLNGRSLGLYVLTEGLTKEFLGQFFARTDGNLYDGGFRKDIDQPLERIGGQGPGDQSDRLALLAAAREPDPRRRWERLKQVLDTDRFITLLAMSTILWNWDGYPMARNNYRIYHDPESDRLVFFPHGQDQMFWEAEGPIYPRLQGLVASAVMRVPAARVLYRERLSTLHTNVFRVDALQQRIDQLATLIRPYRSDSPRQAARLKELIEARSESIGRQLEAAAAR